MVKISAGNISLSWSLATEIVTTDLSHHCGERDLYMASIDTLSGVMSLITLSEQC